MRQGRVARFRAGSWADETSARALGRRLGTVASNNEQVAAPTLVSQHIGDRRLAFYVQQIGAADGLNRVMATHWADFRGRHRPSEEATAQKVGSGQTKKAVGEPMARTCKHHCLAAKRIILPPCGAGCRTSLL